jgi:hypothetical protein
MILKGTSVSLELVSTDIVVLVAMGTQTIWTDSPNVPNFVPRPASMGILSHAVVIDRAMSDNLTRVCRRFSF